MPLPHPRALLRVAATAALLVLALGLPRLLVLCQHAGGAASLTFVHAADSCCHEHEHAQKAVDRDHAGPCAHPHDRCEHTHLAVEMAPAPRPDAEAGFDPLPPCAYLTMPSGTLPPPRAPPPHAAATGPPRVDRRTALRATTLLLV